ncbi:hypothetical protein [Leuconostoc mesenteroides]|uniref:hypothetical protein n=1 Tax=Leuconostoc mesenteroides TaxID=1245 RepID=UPI00235F6A18|nr:hypothetical protein [Leuconostoc mesenteroides]
MNESLERAQYDFIKARDDLKYYRRFVYPHDKQKLKKLTDWRNTTRVRLYRLQQEMSQ